MADNSDYDTLIGHLEAATGIAAKLDLQHAHFLIQMAVLEVADTLSRGRLMRHRRRRRRAHSRRNQSSHNRLNR